MWETQLRQNSGEHLVVGVGKAPGILTYGMNGLVDHNLRKLKLFVFFIADILCDHRRGFVIAAHAISSSVHRMSVGIILIEGTEAGSLANATIAQCTSTVMLPSQVQRFEE